MSKLTEDVRAELDAIEKKMGFFPDMKSNEATKLISVMRTMNDAIAQLEDRFDGVQNSFISSGGGKARIRGPIDHPLNNA